MNDLDLTPGEESRREEAASRLAACGVTFQGSNATEIRERILRLVRELVTQRDLAVVTVARAAAQGLRLSASGLDVADAGQRAGFYALVSAARALEAEAVKYAARDGLPSPTLPGGSPT